MLKPQVDFLIRWNKMNNKKTFGLINLGCRVNLFESTVIIDQMIKSDFSYVKDYKNADIVIINTCSVTSRADRKSRYFINKICNLKQHPILVVAGCYSQINANQIKEETNASIIIGNKYKNKIPELIKEYMQNKKQIVLIDNLFKETKMEEFPTFSFCENTRAVIKIQDGCNFMCSYCLIPFSRGRQRSLNHNTILASINELIKANFYEIILTGVNTAGYLDENNYTFFDLLKDINAIPGKFRVRISSIEPFQISKEIIDLITNNKQRWVQEFHLCLQSANDEILKVMNRKYTVKEFTELCDYIRFKNPLASITTDYIVGYGNETDEIFQDEINNLNKIHFSFMNIFPYSPRPNTAGTRKNIGIDNKIKFARTKQLQKLADEWTNTYLQNFIGKKVEVWFEHSTIKNTQVGHSQYFFKVYVDEANDLHGLRKDVKITKILADNKVYGEII